MNIIMNILAALVAIIIVAALVTTTNRNGKTKTEVVES